jgi:hypothetical protein
MNKYGQDVNTVKDSDSGAGVVGELNENLKSYIESIGLDYDRTMLFLFACKFNIKHNPDDETFFKLVDLNIIERDYVNEKIIVKIPLFKGEIVDSGVIIKELEYDLDRYRLMFRGIRIGAMGNKNSVKNNIIRWLSKNPEYDFEHIIKAVHYYISQTDSKFLANADNFIYNIDSKGEEVSRLSMVIEEMTDAFDKNFS